MKKFASLLAGLMAVTMLTAPAGAFFGSPAREAAPNLPDPNGPNAPATVTIGENGTPLADGTSIGGGTPAGETYVKTEAPDGGYMYIPESEVPLAGVPIDRDVTSPQTGAAGLGAAVALAVLSGAGAAVLAKKAVAC